MLGEFNELGYYKRIAQTLEEYENGASAVKLAERMKVNVVLTKEHLLAAEERGFVCRDESFEGVLWFPNKILSAF